MPARSQEHAKNEDAEPTLRGLRGARYRVGFAARAKRDSSVAESRRWRKCGATGDLGMTTGFRLNLASSSIPCPGTRRHGAAARGGVGTRQRSRASRNPLDFREYHGGFGLQRLFHLLVIFLGEFAGAVFELQIPQIIVNDVPALHELIELRAVRCRIA